MTLILHLCLNVAGMFQVCLAKANCSPPEVLVTQDLLLGEGQGTENGDLLEVAYTGWLFQNHTIGQVSIHDGMNCPVKLK